MTKFPTFLIALFVGLTVFYIGKQIYMQPKFINGETAPDFSTRLMDGTPLQLSDLKGKYVLVDFWGSWCAPCRQENPSLVEFYNKYEQAKFKNAAGFEVLSVGIENNADRWKKAIAQDGLRWKYHVMDNTSNMKFFDGELSGKFGIKQVPTKYLLNPEGQIIGVDQTFEEMDKFLTKRTAG